MLVSERGGYHSWRWFTNQKTGVSRQHYHHKEVGFSFAVKATQMLGGVLHVYAVVFRSRQRATGFRMWLICLARYSMWLVGTV